MNPGGRAGPAPAVPRGGVGISPVAIASALGVAALAGIASLALMLLPAHEAADVTHYKYWARLVAFEGVAGAYSGVYPETAAIYPPLTMYGYELAGSLYRRFWDPEFEMQGALSSRALTVLVKLVAVVPHLALTIVVYLLVASRQPAPVPFGAAVAYGLNPAALFDTAYWGQPDPVHAGLLLLALWSFGHDRPTLGWLMVGLAAAAKPQAWVLLPLLGYVSLRRFGLAGTAAGGLAAAAAGLAVCLPFIAAGTISDLFKLPGLITETMPVASANAHNLWWLATEARPEFVFDADPWLGSVTYRQAAGVLALLLLGFTLWRTDPRGTPEHLLTLGSFLAFGWFMITTRAHENHAFFALPMLAVAAASSRFLAAVFAVISTTLFLNMVMHDFSLVAIRDAWFSGGTWVRLQLANAGLNLLVLLTWARWLAVSQPHPDLSSRTFPTLSSRACEGSTPEFARGDPTRRSG